MIETTALETDSVLQQWFEYQIPDTPPANFDVLGTKACLRRIHQFSAEAQDRLWVKFMYLTPGETAELVLEDIEASAYRGLNARLHLDWHTLLRTRSDRTIIEERLSSTRKAGVEIALVNPPGLIKRLLPQSGCDHRKVIIADNKALLIEPNLSDDNFRSADITVEIWDEAIVTRLAEIFDRGLLKGDCATECTTETTILEDCGRRGKSLILARSVDLVASAQKNVKMMSPYLPDGQMLEQMHHQSKRVNVEVIVPPNAIVHSWNIFGWVNDAARLTAKIRGFEIPVRLHERWGHFKALIIDDKIVVVGSHNFTNKGVMVGTAELSIQSTHPTLVSNMLNFYQGIRADTKAA